MDKLNKQGFQVLEVVIGLGIFFVSAVGALMGAAQYLEGVARAREVMQVQEIARETHHAIEQIAGTDWAEMSIGTHGLAFPSAGWHFFDASDELHAGYTRTITVSEVNRDEQCNIVTVGGTEDPDTREVSTAVSWVSQNGLPRTEVFTEYVTRWHDPQGCTPEGDIAYLNIDVSEARLDSTKKSLVGVEFENEGDVDITIDKMQMTWTKPGNIRFITIEGSHHWHATNGIGSPVGDQPSGTELDIVDLLVEADEDYDVDNIRFDAKLDGSTFHMTVIMDDGSATTSIFFVP